LSSADPTPSAAGRDAVAVSVYGPVGIVDLFVPLGASAADVAHEYAQQAGLPYTPNLHTPLGRELEFDLPLADAGVAGGAVLVATAPGTPSRPRPLGLMRRSIAPGPGMAPGVLSALWVLVSGICAALAGWFAAHLAEDSDGRFVTIVVLVGAAVLAALPVGPLAEHRVLGVPAFAAAAAFAIVWDPDSIRLPATLAICALAAAFAAAVARSLGGRPDPGLRVWIIAGVAVFVVAGAGTLAGLDTTVVWALMLVLAVLAARFVPMLAIDVPDHYLLDFERLAVTAWSAREQPRRRRGRAVVPRTEMADAAAFGTRTVTASAAAILVVAAVAAALLLGEVSGGIQTVGARCEVGFGGAVLLLAARDHRHALARALLRAAGLACWGALVVDVLPGASDRLGWVLAIAAIGLGALLALVAAAVGRGWRSAWWSRRAEWSETVAGALAVAAVVPTAGIFQALWKLTA